MKQTNKTPHISTLTRLLLLLLTTAGTQALMAQNIQTIVNDYAIQGQKFTITYRLSNIDATITTQPPTPDGTILLYGPATSTISSFTYTNGHQTTSQYTDYTYTYRAERPGKTTIPSFTIKAHGKTLSTRQRTITILPPDKNTPRNPVTNQPDPQLITPTTKISPEDLIVTVTLSQNDIYQQQPTIATIKVYTKHPITTFRATTLPTFEGFLSEELPVTQTSQIEHFRGANYYTAILKQCLLYPKKSGKLTITSGRYDVTLQTYRTITQGFMATRQPIDQNVTTTSNTLTINVKPLPQPQPATFTGAVGKYTLTANLTPKNPSSGEPATYQIKISGTGNLKNLTPPTPPLPQNVQTFDPETKIDAQFNGADQSGTYTADYTIIPQTPGTLTIPEWQYTYFDPQTKQYNTITIPAISRPVTKGSTVTTKQKNIDTLTDILHITPLDNLKHGQDKPVITTLSYTLTYIATTLFLITLMIINRRHIRLSADPEARRAARAMRTATSRLHKARLALNHGDTTQYYTQLTTALRTYLSDKLHIPTSQLTRQNITISLQAAGVTEQTTRQLITILDTCEQAQYAPNAGDTDIKNNLYNTTLQTIKQIEIAKPIKTQTQS